MRKFTGFIFIIIILVLVFYLISVHNRISPLTDKQISYLTSTHYYSNKEIPIEIRREENLIVKKINSIRVNKGLIPLQIDKSASLLARYYSNSIRRIDLDDFDSIKFEKFNLNKESAGISDTCFYSLYAHISISKLLERIQMEENSNYMDDSLTHVGIGVIHQLFPWQYWVTVIYIKRISCLENFPIFISEIPSVKELRWEFEKNYSRPKVKIITPMGETEEIDVKRFRDKLYIAKLPFREKGKYIIEILATGPYGVEIANLMPVFVKINREDLSTENLYYPEINKEKLEKTMFELINYDRAWHDMGPLIFSLHLSKAALMHSNNMAEMNKVAHELPGCKNLNQRLEDISVNVFKQGENVASGKDIKDIQKNLMDSPAHRQTMLDPDFTHVGIGIVKKKDLLYITQDFASVIPDITISVGKRRLLDKINRLSFSFFKENLALSSIAQKHSEKMAAIGELSSADELKNELDLRNMKFHQVNFLVINSSTIEQVVDQIKKEYMDLLNSTREIGIGFKQSDNGTLWITIIFKR